MDKYFDISKSPFVGPGELCVVASREQLAGLRSTGVSDCLGSASLVEMGLDDAIPEAVLASARVLVIEVDAEHPRTLRRVREIRDSFPDLKIIAAIAQADVKLVKTLVRQGICDVTELPFQVEELTAQIIEASSEALDLAVEVPLAPIYAVVRSVGGSGSTSVLTHLAAALAEQNLAKRVCVVDLDLQSGEVAAYVGASAPVTLGTLLVAGNRLDDAIVNSATVETQYGFWLVAAPEDLVPLDFAEQSQINAVLSSLRQRFDIVLVDLPANWTNWSLSIALTARAILMVTDSSIASLRQGRRKIDLLESIGVDRKSIKLIANRTERRLFRTIGTEDIADALRADVIASLGDEGGALRAAQDQGILLSDSVGRNAYTRTIADIARRISAEEI